MTTVKAAFRNVAKVPKKELFLNILLVQYESFKSKIMHLFFKNNSQNVLEGKSIII
jgi:hypothetical protein